MASKANKGKGRQQGPLTAIDLFAGAGGLTLAARSLGIRVLAGVEKYKHACDTYDLNFSDGDGDAPRLYREDILELDPVDVLSDLGFKTGDLDILMGGPPCQGYSSHRIKDAGVGDPRNDLLLRYFAYVDVLRPRAFLVENVPGLLWPRHAEYLETFKKAARRAGYILYGPKILNAQDYGVPQNRKRVFIVGIQRDINVTFIWPKQTHFAPGSYDVKKCYKQAWVPAKTVFKRRPKNDPNWVHMNHGQELINAFAATPTNGGSRKDSGRELKCHKNHNGHKDVYGRIDPKKPGPTMTTACINPSKGRFVHPTLNHGITVRHAARFQFFPDGFIFCGGLIASGIQVGNAVPVLLGEAVLGSVISALHIHMGEVAAQI